ncbi:twin-arginine translocation signal domain-containing protein [Cryobacterium breve]|uniref:Twin-arginine translocation signal domain-containing protein n=2 Tax=Cryobacterium TaxID=69578 RepID=A0ABY2JA13_9MICO|nr:molybdopterin-dependent oxidoreductase [Cryobacterium breve]TFC90384.1 twin-arginine translocation signal domain-containing protein [Cryobacterium sp. TmT3-12]TFD01801.1 twin-arginine translocation signal domain-containing protein [Cryobacterium breve]
MRRMMYEAQRALASPARNPRMAVVIGRLLGIAFIVCFGTGLYSHFLQEPLPWMRFPTRPALLYQFSQGTHIIAGIACFPLLLAKLYIVFPDLFQYPPVKSFLHLLERASIALFVGASLVQITIGLLNTYQWYPWPFPFREVHYALGWVLIGLLVLHIGIKLPIITRFWNRRGDAERDDDEHDATVAEDEAVRLWGSRRPSGVTGRLIAWIDATPALKPTATPAVSRRGFLTTVGVACAAVVGLTAGQTFAPLDALNVFGPRKKGVGQQGVPVNRTAEEAKVTASALATGWVLTLTAGDVERSFSRTELESMPQTEVELPIACVEGWSQLAVWRGVRLSDLADLVAADTQASFRLTSLEERGSFRQTEMGPEYVRDPLTLVALELNGETLDVQHGYPARMIAPGRPGVLQTKWLSRIEAITA